jgi:tetratricopeptide (TPR) repeat protein
MTAANTTSWPSTCAGALAGASANVVSVVPDPSPVERALHRATTLLELHRYQECLDLLGPSGALDPTNPAVHVCAARALLGLDRNLEAAAAARAAVQVKPDLAEGHALGAAALVRAALRDHRDQAAALASHAVVAGREAVRLRPLAIYYADLAQAAAIAGDRFLADRAARQAIRLSPGTASVWVAASLVAIRNRNWSAAAEAANRALSIDPTSSAALNNLGVAMRNGFRMRSAARLFADAARQDPTSKVARNNLTRSAWYVLSIAGIAVITIINLLVHGILGPLALAWVVMVVLVRRNPKALGWLERFLAPLAVRLARPGRPPRRRRHTTSRRGRAGTVEPTSWTSLKARERRAAAAREATW